MLLGRENVMSFLTLFHFSKMNLVRGCLSGADPELLAAVELPDFLVGRERSEREKQQCGGPVVDLNGNVIGINIARAGRIKTYTIPAADILALLEPEFERIAREKSGLPEKINRPKKPGPEGEVPLPPEENPPPEVQ